MNIKRSLWFIGIFLSLLLIAVIVLVFSPKTQPELLPTILAINTSSISLEASPSLTASSSTSDASSQTLLPTLTEANQLTPQVTLAATNTPFIPTDLPITPNLEELSLQERIQFELLNLEPVESIITFDLDMPSEQPPLVYLEVLLQVGYNNVQTMQLIKLQLDLTLNTSQYSDFMVLASDGIRAVEYHLDSMTGEWVENELPITSFATPENP